VRPLHLAGRFVRALWWAAPRPADERWAASLLLPGERSLWERLPNYDRRYSIRVARDADARLHETGYEGDGIWPAAALLHDVGKLSSGLGVSGRVVATVAGALRPSLRRSNGRVGRYLRHDEEGARLLRAAGGREEAVRWAAAHHRPLEWAAAGIPALVAEALAAADGE
jgi:hypothetical protein